jgi:hypothetical protein
MQTATLSENAQLVLDTIAQKPTRGIPHKMLNIMEHAQIDRLAGAPPGSYARDPERIYLAMQKRTGACGTDQFIPRNPLSMGSHGYEPGTERKATTGLERIVRDGMEIDSPEAVAGHLERFVFPALERDAAACNPNDDAAVAALIAGERQVQDFVGPDILKIPYGRGFQFFPAFRYGSYGYVNYFMAYALYPELMERDFRLQADLAEKKSAIAARAYREGSLPPLLRLDHDMADARSTLVDIESLDRIWFPQFVRSIRPLLDAGVRLIWHCDGNLMQMVPRLLEAGLSGFQGFQYEHGMDYEKICAMKARDGRDLIIQAGVSVTKTLPHGSPEDVRRELAWLVEQGPRTGLFLGASSSVAPGAPARNLDALVAGLKHYRQHGRN